MNTAIVLVSETALSLAQTISKELGNCSIWSTHSIENGHVATTVQQAMKQCFEQYTQIIFMGALGICVRSMAECIRSKYKDPAVVCLDSKGDFVIPVLSGHIGGANKLAQRIAAITGGQAVVTTQSDRNGLWALDTLAQENGWQQEHLNASMNDCITRFVNGRPTALLIECRDEKVQQLKKTVPEHVTVFSHFDEIHPELFELLIAVTPFLHEDTGLATLYYRPAVLHLGFGCRKQCCASGIPAAMCKGIQNAGLSPLSVGSISTHVLKQDEPLLIALQQQFPWAETHIYETEEVKDIQVPNPSEKAFSVTGLYGVAEGTALKSSHHGHLIIEKQKGCLNDGANFTYALALDRQECRQGHIEIVGAGPGDPELISVRGKRMLQQADLVLYAGSLVPYELTLYAPEGAVVRSSASLDLEEQFTLMKEFYDQGKFIVRLHTGDPCIYGAIQEQMAFFDQYGMEYHITPGISSFQAAAAELKSQFTIPEKVQSIILTRGEGRTPMPEKEQLHKLAQSQSTMCIYLSAGIVEDVQAELLQAYPPETPVAACYKLTWKEQRIYRGQLKDLARLVRDNHLTLTTLLVVGESIDNRKGLSKLYSSHFTHLFRDAKE